MKVLKVAAIVVGVVALAATGIGLAAGAGSLAAAFGAGMSTLGLGSIAATIGSGALATIAMAAVAMDISMIAGALAPKPSGGGSQTKWKADPYAGIPYVMGRTKVGGNLVFKRGHGKNNKYLTTVTALGLGPFAAITATAMDKTPTTFGANGAALGKYAGQIWQRTQLGACPEASALSPPVDAPPGWTVAHKLSGLAAAMNTFAYDAQNENGLTSIPPPSWIVQAGLVYDPRLDSTYPGGSGPCRAYDESTYVYSEDPHLHGLTWAMGRYQNGTRVAGIGPDRGLTIGQVKGIDVAAFVEGANLNQARGWKIGGQVYTRPDTPWNSLKAMLQAGGARPVLVGGIISCINRAPRVSLATITRDDIAGACKFAATQKKRSRINAIIPQYRSEAHDWEMVSGKRVSVSAFETMDGDERTRELPYPLVQQVTQASQIAALDIYELREAGPGTVPLKPWWLNYRIGDCVTFAPEDGFALKTLVTGRGIDAQTGAVTFTLRGETDGKHDYALGLTGTPPPVASLTYADEVEAPEAGEWQVQGGQLSAGDVSVPALIVTGACANSSAEAVVVEYRLHSAGQANNAGWQGASVGSPTLTRKELTSVTGGTEYDVAVRYRVRGRLGARRILGPVTTGAFVGLEGPPGEQGPQGVPGAPGANGNSSFTHYAYANSADGSIDFTIGAPGERAFEGVYVDQVEADSTNPASYAWREYKGPPFGMAGTNVSIAGNQVIKVPSAAYEWNSQAYSTVGYKNGCRTAFRIGNDQRVMAGLNQDPTADSSYNSLDYAWYVNETEVKIYRSGSEIPGFVIPNYIGQGTFEVVYDGRYVRFLYLGVERHKEDIGPGYQFYFDSSIATVQGRIADVEFGAFPQQRSGNVTLLTQTSANTEVLGGSARNTVNLGWGAGLVYSQEQYARGASVSWTYPAGPNSNMMAGLEEVPTGDKGNSYESVTFAIFRRDDGVTAAYVQGAQLPFAGPTVDMNQPTRCRVQFDGKKYVRFYINDVEFANYEWYGSVNPLRFRAAMASLGARVEDVTLTGSGKDGDKGEKGDPGADGLQGPQGIQGPAGSNGQTSYVHFAYADSADGTVNFTTGAAAGRTYIGVYSDFTAADSNSPGAYTWSLIKGAQGDQGTPGPAGSNGQPSYVHIAYANSANGQTDFHLSDPTGRTYIGVYTDGTPADSGDPAAYTWSLIKGADGQDGFTISPPSTAWSIATTQNGVPKSGQLPRSVTLKVLRGSADITGSCIFALANTTGFSGSMSGATFTATGLSVDSAKASVVVTYQGVQIGTVEITLDKQPEGAAAQQFKQSFNALGNTATYAFTQQIDVTVPAGSTLSADATASYSTTSTTYKPQLKLTYQNLTDGGAELDFEGNNPASGETAYVSEPAGVFGPSGSLPTGHTSSKTYRVKLYSRRETGAGSSTNVSGNLYVRTS